MNLKRNLLISNFIMVAVPFIVSVIIGGCGILYMYNSYWSPMEKMFSDPNEMAYAQSLIYGELENLSNDDPINAEQRLQAEKRLVVEMADLGFHIQYRLNGNEEFSNITPEDEEKERELLGPEALSLRHVTASKADMHLIKSHWVQGKNSVDIKAVNPGKAVRPVIFSFFSTYIGFFVALLLICVLITIVIINVVIYKRASRNILQPLQQISAATKAIRSGDLTTPVSVSGAEEFIQVGKDFMDMQAYLRDSVAKQIEYNRRRRELLSGISHDLRTPLTSIKGYAEGLQAGIADTPEKQRRYYAAIKTRADDLERLVNNLSLYNKSATTLFMYRPEKCSLSDVLKAYVEEEEERFQRDHVRIEWNLGTTEDSVYIDVQEFHRVLDNLFNNAVKYRVKDTSLIRLGLQKEARVLTFYFSDDGPGIAEDSTDDIFEAFVRLDTARSHIEQGSGLGLAIVKRIVEAHKGTVRACNDHGLTICITLPLYK